MSPPSRPFRPLRAAIAFILISAVFVPARAGCPAATVRLRAAPQPNELPRRVVANRDASIAPLDYFFMPEDGNLGAGAFGSVSVGQLKGARPTGLTEGEDYLREFAIKYQKWYSPPIDAWAENLTAYASFSEVHLMRQVAGGPYLAKFWGNWSVAPCTHRGVRKLHSFSIALTKAATTLDKEARERANAKFFPRQSGGIPEADVKKIVAQIAVAVGWLHQNGIIHRDLKMPNILLDGAGRVMLGDFGCAIRNSDILTGRPPEMPEVRAPPSCDISIVAPESMQIVPFRRVPANRGKPFYDASIDWWALGVVTWQMLAGNPHSDSQALFKFSPRSPNWIPYWRGQFGKPPPPTKEWIKRSRLDFVASDGAKGFILALLNPDPARRLGSYQAEGRKGWHAILCHPWLRDVDEAAIIRDGEAAAREANAPLVWRTRDGKPPDPKRDLIAQLGPAEEPPSVAELARQIEEEPVVVSTVVEEARQYSPTAEQVQTRPQSADRGGSHSNGGEEGAGARTSDRDEGSVSSSDDSTLAYSQNLPPRPSGDGSASGGDSDDSSLSYTQDLPPGPPSRRPASGRPTSGMRNSHGGRPHRHTGGSGESEGSSPYSQDLPPIVSDGSSSSGGPGSERASQGRVPSGRPESASRGRVGSTSGGGGSGGPSRGRRPKPSKPPPSEAYGAAEDGGDDGDAPPGSSAYDGPIEEDSLGRLTI